MWQCAHCLQENQDTNNMCSRCGAVRGRHFAAPSVQPAARGAAYAPADGYPAEDRRRREERYAAPRRNPRTPEVPPPQLRLCARLCRFCGLCLALLLPLLCALLCWKQYDALYGALVPLLTGSGEQTLTGQMVYALWCACGLLLSLAPGLSLMTLAQRHKPNKVKETSSLL